MKKLVGYFFNEKSLKEFGNILKQNNYRGSAEGFFRKNLLYGLLLGVASGFFCVFYGHDVTLAFGFGFVAFFVPLGADYFVHCYRFDSRKKAIEKLTPDLLLQASTFPPKTTLEIMIKKFSQEGKSKLACEFGKTLLELEKGASVEVAIENMKARNRSGLLNRALDLLLHSYYSGADMGETFMEAADAMLESAAIVSEREATMFIEKMTLVGASAVLVPFILGLLVGMVGKLDFADSFAFGIGMKAAERKEILSAAAFGNLVYLVEFALITSAFIANQENDLKRAAVYAVFLAPIALFCYGTAVLVAQQL